jgi:hypothetical protein
MTALAQFGADSAHFGMASEPVFCKLQKTALSSLIRVAPNLSGSSILS